MNTTFILTTLLLTPHAPVPHETSQTPTGPAPWMIYLKEHPSGTVGLMLSTLEPAKVIHNVTVRENGKVITKQVESQITRRTFSRLTLDQVQGSYTSASGKPVTASEVSKRAKDGLAILISADGKPIDPAWLRIANPHTVVLASAAFQRAQTITPVVPCTTSAPQLALLKTDPAGHVVVPGRSHPNRVATRVRIGGAGLPNAQPLPALPVAGRISPPQAGGSPNRRLEDVPFEAYDLAGKSVARADALTRLKFGGMVLLTPQNLPPDAAYLRLFRGDLLVLASPEFRTNSTMTTTVATPVIGVGGVRAVPVVAPIPAVPLVPAKPIQKLAPPAVVPAAPKLVPAQPVKP